MPEEIVAILPPLIAIILAWATKQIIPALLSGLLVGSFLVEPGLITGIAKMVEYVEATSPLSGMTVMAAGAAEAEHMEYVEAQMPYNLMAFVLAAILFLIVPFLM